MARDVIAEAGRWIAAGGAAGALLAWMTTRAIESQLFEVAAADPVSWGAALTVLGAALLVAVAQPAARAAHVNPIVALQADE
jgi:hypothetical protein